MIRQVRYAIMAQRHDSAKTDPDADFYPTPPWAIRALMEYAPPFNGTKFTTCLEPACGDGTMSRTLSEYFDEVKSCDLHDRGYGTQQDFLTMPTHIKYDWVITNPPFSLAEQFILKAFEVSTVGVAMFARTQLLEGKGRYQRLYSPRPPTYVMPFVERVPIFKRVLKPNASTATSYSWFVWHHTNVSHKNTLVLWIPPCRDQLEREGDYV